MLARRVFYVLVATSCVLAATANDASVLAASPGDDSSMVIRSDAPAKHWKMGYPVGNGRLGMLSLGAWPKEQLYLNEDSIWARAKNEYPPNTAAAIREVRRLANAGKYAEADKVFVKKLVTNYHPGSYEFAGIGVIEHRVAGAPNSVSNTLDLRTGLNRSVAEYSDGRIIREIIALRNRDLIAVHISTTRPHGLDFKLALEHPRDQVVLAENALVLSGQAKGKGTRYESRLLLCPGPDGHIKKEGSALLLKGGKEALILFCACTDYNIRNPAVRLDHWQNKAAKILAAARAVPWDTLCAEGSKEMGSFMGRCTLDLGTSPADVAKLPTPARIERYRRGGTDLDLEEMLFQFGRYLLVASNRPGGLPANLQGLWSAGLTSPWAADYHLNINIQMNYWPAEPTGLSELHQPLLDLAIGLRPGGEAMASALGYQGFCTGHAVNAWKTTWFSGNRPCWAANLISGAWLTAHMMEHYRFSGDKQFVAQKAWPQLKANCSFILDWLEREPGTGQWITGPGSSPENTFIYTDAQGKKRAASISCGTTHDLMLAWESLTDLLEAARVLGREQDALVQRAAKVLPELAQAKIGPDGRLQEWRKPFAEKNPGHRHLSHVYGFFPGHQYNILTSPKMVAAVKKSLDYRLAHGGGHTGWSRAWLINIEACLMRSEAAYESVRGLITEHINPNLFDMIGRPGTRGPFQIDGNFGYTSGLATMLLQSQIELPADTRVLWLLPALPKAWPTGSVAGLHARGGAMIDLHWNPKQVQAKIRAPRAGRFQVRCRNQVRHIELAAGQTVTLQFD